MYSQKSHKNIWFSFKILDSMIPLKKQIENLLTATKSLNKSWPIKTMVKVKKKLQLQVFLPKSGRYVHLSFFAEKRISYQLGLNINCYRYIINARRTKTENIFQNIKKKAQIVCHCWILRWDQNYVASLTGVIIGVDLILSQVMIQTESDVISIEKRKLW